MQSLFYALTGRGDEQHPQPKDTDMQVESKEVFESLEVPGDQTINQIQRKTRLINEFKTYIENANNKTIYYHYIIDTEIYEGVAKLHYRAHHLKEKEKD